FDSNAVAAHNWSDLLPVAVEDGGSHGLGVLISQLEDVTYIDGFAKAERAAIDRATFSFEDVAYVSNDCGLEVAVGSDVAEVILLPISACNQVCSAFQGLIEDDESSGFLRVRRAFDTYGAKV